MRQVSKTNLILSLLTGSVFGGLSVLMIRSPERVGAAVVLLFPGFIVGIAMNGNVHDFNTCVVALGNLAFYFGLVYLGCRIWARRTRRAADASRDDPRDD
jgi:hypothetical protein